MTVKRRKKGPYQTYSQRQQSDWSVEDWRALRSDVKQSMKGASGGKRQTEGHPDEKRVGRVFDERTARLARLGQASGR
jgi:hypothetical protein